MKRIISYLLISFFTITTIAQTKQELKEQAKSQHKPYHYFEDPKVCSGCHMEKFKRWNVSQHSKSFSGDFFQKQFYDLVLASESFAPELKDIKNDCISCHSPSSFLANDFNPSKSNNPDNHWSKKTGDKSLANRGVFCDFCHTIDYFKHPSPFNADYVSLATEAVDTKLGDLEFPWSPHHETATSEIYEASIMCATCHDELNPYDVWVKSTFAEYEASVYPSKGIICQTCHMEPMGGKPAKMGINRPYNSDHWWGGGFAGFVEGAALVEIKLPSTAIKAGEKVDFTVDVQAVATGHKFPTGSTEERDVWLRLSLVDKDGKELLHIPVPKNQDNPDDHYFITTNEKVAYPSHSKLSEPFERDALPEGDRIYHSAFLDSEGEFTYAQWFCVKEIENRLNPLEIRKEKYSFTIPSQLKDEVFLQAELNYRRMPDSFADYLKIDRRPVILISKDIRKITLD